MDAIRRGSPATEVVVLEVAVGFPETQQVEEVVHARVVVEDVQDLLIVTGRIGRIELDHSTGRRSPERLSVVGQNGRGVIALGSVLIEQTHPRSTAAVTIAHRKA